jgi:hypothetical protein
MPMEPFECFAIQVFQHGATETRRNTEKSFCILCNLIFVLSWKAAQPESRRVDFGLLQYESMNPIGEHETVVLRVSLCLRGSVLKKLMGWTSGRLTEALGGPRGWSHITQSISG